MPGVMTRKGRGVMVLAACRSSVCFGSWLPLAQNPTRLLLRPLRPDASAAATVARPGTRCTISYYLGMLRPQWRGGYGKVGVPAHINNYRNNCYHDHHHHHHQPWG